MVCAISPAETDFVFTWVSAIASVLFTAAVVTGADELVTVDEVFALLFSGVELAATEVVLVDVVLAPVVTALLFCAVVFGTEVFVSDDEA
jgi:hypothetical protein